MPAVRKKTGEVRKDVGGDAAVEEEVSTPRTAKPVHVTPENIVGTLNGAVANINAVFQLRDQLQAEIGALKEELALGGEVRIEAGKLEALKREQDEFLYEYQIKKARLERELKDLEEESKNRICEGEEGHKEKLASQTEEQKAQLKAVSDAHTLKLKLEREDHERKIKLEREDWQREQARHTTEKAAFEERIKVFEARSASLREDLAKELNRDNAHAIEVLKLNHQKELELSKSELRLEQANRAKFEAMLRDSREQNEKLGEQLTALSREALASASSSSMAAKLKDIVAQMAGGTSARVS